jgi:DNA repair protein RadC
VFHVAVVMKAAFLVLIHNHPSGDPLPSEADTKITRDLIRAGQMMKIELTDRVIMGNGKHFSLKEFGYFYH